MLLLEHVLPEEFTGQYSFRFKRGKFLGSGHRRTETRKELESQVDQETLRRLTSALNDGPGD